MHHAIPDRFVLLIVLLERQDGHERRHDRRERDLIPVLERHARRAPSRIVLQPRPVFLQHGLQPREHGVEMPLDLLLVLARGDEQTDGEHGVGFRAGVLVVEAMHEDLEQRRRVRCHCNVHGADAFGEDADGGGALVGFGAGGEAEEDFFDELVELGEGGAEDMREGDEDVERGVDDEPVVFRGLQGARVEVFVWGAAG